MPRQTISPQANIPIMGIVQDRPCGIRFTFLAWNHVQNILLWIPDWDGTSSHPVFDDGIRMIDNGEIMFGIVDKKTVGAMQGGLIHVVFCEKGPEATRRLFTGIQTVVNFWLFHNGFSVGIGNTIRGPKVMNYIAQHIGDKKQQVAEIIEDAYHDRLKPMPGMTIREPFESKAEVELGQARDDSGQYAQKNLKEDNNTKQMVTAGSKGSYINISQMSVCVGQQSVEG
ncbi:beta and beta-prime subunits of DNA dependent RNA-polymerase [Paxillus ammoniavirescens]|nr:beta and beta-prime subunits of DNA dependent RNA-polymerase [Paxillus ammoniavirescens]